MMICKADFEELFPDLFPSEEAPVAQPMAQSPSPAGPAPQEAEATAQKAPMLAAVLALAPILAPQPREAGRPAPGDGDYNKIARAGAIAATAPAVATYTAASSMLSAYDQMTARR